MAFATADFSTAHAKTEKKQGFFSRALDAMIDARMREAERQVVAQLLSFDDKTLASLGYERSELEARHNRFR